MAHFQRSPAMCAYGRGCSQTACQASLRNLTRQRAANFPTSRPCTSTATCTEVCSRLISALQGFCLHGRMGSQLAASSGDILQRCAPLHHIVAVWCAPQMLCPLVVAGAHDVLTTLEDAPHSSTGVVIFDEVSAVATLRSNRVV